MSLEDNPLMRRRAIKFFCDRYMPVISRMTASGLPTTHIRKTVSDIISELRSLHESVKVNNHNKRMWQLLEAEAVNPDTTLDAVRYYQSVLYFRLMDEESLSQIRKQLESMTRKENDT